MPISCRFKHSMPISFPFLKQGSFQRFLDDGCFIPVLYPCHFQEGRPCSEKAIFECTPTYQRFHLWSKKRSHDTFNTWIQHAALVTWQHAREEGEQEYPPPFLPAAGECIARIFWECWRRGVPGSVSKTSAEDTDNANIFSKNLTELLNRLWDLHGSVYIYTQYVWVRNV